VTGAVDILSSLRVETQKSVKGVHVIDVSTESGQDDDNNEAKTSIP